MRGAFGGGDFGKGEIAVDGEDPGQGSKAIAVKWLYIWISIC